MPTIKRELPADDARHGTLNGYNNYGCRCEKCSIEAKKSWTERQRKIKAAKPAKATKAGKPVKLTKAVSFTIRGTRNQKGEPNKEPRKPKASKYCSDIDFDYSVLKGAQEDPTALCMECGTERPELALVYKDEFCSAKCCRLFYNVKSGDSRPSSGVRATYVDWRIHHNLGPRQEPYTESAASKVA